MAASYSGPIDPKWAAAETVIVETRTMTFSETVDTSAPNPRRLTGADLRREAQSSPPILIVPGVNGSGPAHWQSLWEQNLPNAERVEQSDRHRPRLSDWTATLAEAVRRRPGALLVAHSLGCALVAHFARISGGRSVAAALLVAPADVDAETHHGRNLAAFAPMPQEPLAFPSLVAASRNDPFVRFERAEAFAKDWRSRFVDLGLAGHVNVKSGHGPWDDGLPLLESLLDAASGEARRAG